VTEKKRSRIPKNKTAPEIPHNLDFITLQGPIWAKITYICVKSSQKTMQGIGAVEDFLYFWQQSTLGK